MQMSKFSSELYIQSHGMPIDDDLANAINRDDLVAVSAAILRGSTVSAFSSRGLPAFVEAKSKKMVELLISFGLDIEAPIFADNTTLLMSCCGLADLDFLSALISCGANVNATNKKGETGLFSAVMANKPKAILLLLRNGANINAQDVEGNSPLSWAVSLDKSKIVELLLTEGADPNLVDCDGESILETAVIFFERGRLGNIELLVTYGADINHQRSGDRLSLLHMACRRNYFEVVEFLLAKGADSDAKCSTAQTPYDLAVENDAIESMRILDAPR